MDYNEGGFNMKKTFITALVGAGALAGAGLLAYFALEDKMKAKQCLQRSSSNLTVSDLSLSQSRAYTSGLNDSSGTLVSLTSFCSDRSEYETADEMDSTVTKVNSESKYYDITSNYQDEFLDLTPDEETLAIDLNERNNIVKRNKESALFENVDRLMKGKDDDRLQAYVILKNHELEMTENPEFLWRFAKAHHIQASIFGSQNDLNKKKEYVNEGKGYASKALALDSENADAHKWFAILTGMQGDFVPIKEKIKAAKVFLKHLLIALHKKENDYSLHYLLARFKYQIANSSWLERKIASKIFDEIPTFTYQDPIPHLLRSEELNSTPWKDNRLLLAKCYIGCSDYKEALKWLRMAKEIPCLIKEDEVSDQEIQVLLDQYRGYDE